MAGFDAFLEDVVELDLRGFVAKECEPALGELLAGDRLEVRPSGSRITLLHPPGYDYFRLLRSKLHWGRGSFDHER
jgi:NAD+ kinase